MTVGDETHHLSVPAARRLRESLGEALTDRREFLRTVGVRRADGSYVVRRRGADSSGNARVFADAEELRALFDRLPAEFDATDVGAEGPTGSRRHLVVRHLAEHPGFPCELTCRNPLEARKLDRDR